MSFHLPRPEPEDETEDINHIKSIGGFRRDFLRRTQGPPTHEGFRPEGSGFFTRNFIEFLTLHGHFAGEDLEDDEGWEPVDEGDITPDETESQPLMGGRRMSLARKPSKIATGTAGSGKAILLLLKSFVGTGVLFLPKAYLNGGMLFSNLVLLFVSALSYYCFVLLVRTRLRVVGSFGGLTPLLNFSHVIPADDRFRYRRSTVWPEDAVLDPLFDCCFSDWIRRGIHRFHI
jgi:proton-coupled amino acid transporter